MQDEKRRARFQERIEAELEELFTGIEQIKMRAGEYDLSRLPAIEDDIRTVEEKYHQAAARLHRLKASAAHHWDAVRKHIEEAHEDLKAAYQRLADRLK